jgi:hypothetical protein
MGKVFNHLQKQMTTNAHKDAEDCMKIYNALAERDGAVWASEWNLLVYTTFTGRYPNTVLTFKPSSIGYTFLKGLEALTHKILPMTVQTLIEILERVPLKDRKAKVYVTVNKVAYFLDEVLVSINEAGQTTDIELVSTE